MRSALAAAALLVAGAGLWLVLRPRTQPDPEPLPVAPPPLARTAAPSGAADPASAASAGDPAQTEAAAEALRLNERALELLAAGDAAGAEALLVRACALAPAQATLAVNLSRTRVRLGRAAEDDGQHRAALAWFRAAEAASADGGAPAEWEAGLLLRDGAREEARARVLAALAAFPQAAGLLRLRGELAFVDGDLDAAVAAYAAALEQEDRADTRERLAQLEEERRLFARFLTDSTAHCESRFDPEDAGLTARMPELRAALEEAWQDVTGALGVQPASRLLVLWLSPERYRGAAPEWSGGLYDGRVRVLVDPERGADAQLRATLRHELTHAVLHSLGARLPTWLHEGLAQRAEGRSPARARESLRGQVLRVDAAALEGNWTLWTDRTRLEQAYALALSQVAWLDENFGPTAIPNLLTTARALGYEAAWTRVFARSYAEIEAEHRASLGAARD